MTMATPLLAFVGIGTFILMLNIEQTEQRPDGAFIQTFDRNMDGKVDINNEIDAYYEKIKDLLLAAVSEGNSNGTELIENASASANNSTTINDNNNAVNNNRTTAPAQVEVDAPIGLNEFRRFLQVSEAKLVDDKLTNGSDVNGDGLLSIGEQANFTRTFASNILDTNGDGIVSEEESVKYDNDIMGRQFKKYDADNDGKMNGTELEEMLKEFVGPLREMIGPLLPQKKDLPLEKAKELLGKEFGVRPEKVEEADLDGNKQLAFQTEFLDQIGLPIKMAMQTFNATLDGLIDAPMVEKADRDENGFLTYSEIINLLTRDMALKLGDGNKDELLDFDEFRKGFNTLNEIYHQKGYSK